MSLTKPAFCWYHTLTAVTHIVVRYADATTQNVSLAAGTYPASPSVTVSDLLGALEVHLNADATNGGTWDVSFSTTTYKITITASGGAKVPNRLTFGTSELTPYDLGFNPDSGTTIVDADGAGTFTADWPMRRFWAPDDWVTVDAFEIDEVSVQRRSRYSGRVVAEKRSQSGGVVTYRYEMPFVAGPRVFGYAADHPDLYAGDSNVLQNDPNVSLDRFRERYFGGIASNALPRARAIPDVATPGTYDDVTLFVGQPAMADVSDQRQPVSTGPLLYSVVILAAAYVA